MKLTGKQWIRAGFLMMCWILLIVVSITVLNRKEAFFLDEYSSYSCANSVNGRIPQFENGVVYTMEEVHQLELDTYGVRKDERFRFDSVWKNLETNVHPPVFYLLLHFVCSLTPGVFSVWQAAAVNLFFGIISLIFFKKTAKALLRSEWAARLLTLAWTGTQCLYANIVFLRDYSAAMCAVVITVWEAVRVLQGNQKTVDLFKLALASVFSVLSHYYCIIYLFFVCAVLCVTLIIRKEWKTIWKIAAAETGAAAAAVAIFPAMIRRILQSSRGTEAVTNLKDGDAVGYVKRLSIVFNEVNDSIFGGLLPWVLFLLAILVVVGLIMKKKTLPALGLADNHFGMAEIFLILLPVLFYCLVVIKLAPFTTIRYLYPVIPLLYLSVTTTMTLVGRRLVGKKTLTVALVVILAGMCWLSWQSGDFNYLYSGRKEALEKYLKPYQGIDAVQIWSKRREKIGLMMPQADYFSSMVFYYQASDEELARIPVLLEGKDALVMIGTEDKETIKKLMNFYPNYTVTVVGNKRGMIDGQERIHYCFHNTGQ